jgi:hypothetical protein
MSIHYLEVIIIVMLVIILCMHTYRPIEHIGSNNVLTHSYLFPGIHPNKSNITLVKR